MNSRRSPLDKEHFLEGNRQKFVMIGLIITLIVLFSNILFRVDPAPYLQSVMLLIGCGILGWSVDSAVKAYKVDSISQTTNATTTANSTVTNIQASIDAKLNLARAKEDDYAHPSN